MDNNNLSSKNQKIETQEMKVEESEMEDISYTHEPKQERVYMEEEIEFGKTALVADISNFECIPCDGMVFTKESSLKHHVNECHNKNVNEKQTQSFANTLDIVKFEESGCNECEVSIVEKTLYTLSDENLYKCSHSGCGSSFQSRSKLILHSRLHVDIRTLKSDYDSNEAVVDEEIATEQASEEGILTNIDQCTDAKILNERNDVHSNNHSGEKHFKCGEAGCKESFRTQARLESHRVDHSGQTFQCNYQDCDEVFNTRMSLWNHLRLHSEDLSLETNQNKDEFRCYFEGCEAKFNESVKLVHHVRLHTSDAPSCYSSSVGEHNEETMLRSKHKYRCYYVDCEATFQRTNGLIPHLKSHASGKLNNFEKHDDLICTFEGCYKGFRNQARLNYHMRVHAVAKPFICLHEGCGKAYKWSSQLKHHQISH